MKHINNKKLIVIVFSALLVFSFIGYFAFSEINAYGVTKTISDTLATMQISDSVRSAELEDYFAEAESADFICFASDRAQMVFHFDKKSGMLLRADSYALLFPEKSTIPQDTVTASTDTNREKESLALAEKLISGHQIGELQIEKTSSTQLWDRFYVVEYYNGEPTGTTITVAWEDNRIMSGIPHFGSIFSTDKNGNIMRNRPANKLAEEEAIAFAINAVEELTNSQSLNLNSTSCDLVTIFGDYCYEVHIILNTTGEDSFNLSYIVVLDAYTGEILEIQYSK